MSTLHIIIPSYKRNDIEVPVLINNHLVNNFSNAFV